MLDSEKTSDSGVLTNNSGGSTPVNVIPVQLSHTAAPFHMECPQPFEILHSAPILVHHHHLPAADHHQMAAYYQPIPQYATEQLAPIGYQVIPEEQAADVVGDDDDDDDDHQLQNSEPTASYSAENSDSGISSPNSEVMVKGGSSKGTDDKNEKPKSGDAGNVAVISGTGSVESTSAMTTATTTTSKKSRNKKNKGRDKGSDSTKVTAKQGNKTATVNQQKSDHHVHHEVASVGSKKSSKIAKEPAIIKKLNAKKAKSGGKPETDKPETCKSPPPPPPQLPVRSVDDDDDDGDDDERSAADPVSADDGGMSEEIIQLSIGPVDAEWMQEEVFCSLECTPRSTTTDHVQFQFAKTHSVDSCESVEEETFATAVNTGNSDTENETVLRQDEPTKLQQDPLSRSVSRESDAADTSVPPSTVAAPGPITEAVTKWLNDQGGLMLAPCLDDSSCTDEGELSEYDDFEEHSTVAVANASPKNVQGNPYPALSRSEAGSRVAGASPHDQRQAGGLVSSGICCLTQ